MGPVLTYANICSIIWFATVKSAEHRDSAIEQCKCGARERRIADDHLTLIPSRIRAGLRRLAYECCAPIIINLKADASVYWR